MSAPYTGMSLTEKFTREYTADDIALLLDLRSRKPPVGWTKIARDHFPDRSPAALKAKVQSLPAPGVERPKLDEDDAQEPWKVRAAEGSAKLLAAIDALRERNGGRIAA